MNALRFGAYAAALILAVTLCVAVTLPDFIEVFQ